MNWTNYSLHLLNSSHKLISDGGEFILLRGKKIVHTGWTNIRQGVVKFMPSEARLEFFLMNYVADKLE